jgi:hypothetical protein
MTGFEMLGWISLGALPCADAIVFRRPCADRNLTVV